MTLFAPRLEITEIVPGIWRVRAGSRSGAAYLVKTSPGAVLIDAGRDAGGAAVMQGFQRARVGLRSIRAILLTGAAPGASGGAAALRERSGARLLCSRETAERLRPSLEPDGLLQPGEVLEKHFEVLAAPAGGLGFLFRPDRALFTGEAPAGSFASIEARLVLPARGPVQLRPSALMASMS